MIRGLYTSALGMTTQMKRMDVISNNIANSDTTGFKRDVSITSSFPEELTKRINDRKNPAILTQVRSVGNMNMGVFIDEIRTDFSQGNMKRTENTFDLGISGNGYFAVSVTDNGNTTEKYTRDGAFTVSDQRVLMTKDGNTVVGQNGEITVGDGNITIDDFGNIFVNDEFVDQIKMVDFEDSSTLRKVGNSLYDTSQNSVQTAFTGTVMQGYLEASNINAVREMVDLIAVSRAYESNQKMIQIQDSTLSRAVSEIGRK